jgi:hypothetical protein
MSPDIQAIIDKVIYYATLPQLQSMLLPAKLTFVVITFVMLSVLVFTILKTHYFQWMYFRDLFEFLTHRGYGTSKITKLWNKTLKRLDSPLESEYKLAIIEADDILDSSLKKIGYPGQTLEERLGKLTQDTIANIEEVKLVHKVRNNIVHDPDYRLSSDEVKKTIDVYASAFRDLQILD